MTKPTVYHIPVCPFCQWLEILLSLKGRRNAVNFHVIDITQPRPDWLLAKTQGTTALPVLETEDGKILKESMVLLEYLEEIYPDRRVAQRDPYRHAVENMLARMEGDFCTHGYMYILNKDTTRRDSVKKGMLDQYSRINWFLNQHSPSGPFLFEEFGWAETVFTPLFMRFWFLEYYEGFELPDDEEYARVCRPSRSGARPAWPPPCRAGSPDR